MALSDTLEAVREEMVRKRQHEFAAKLVNAVGGDFALELLEGGKFDADNDWLRLPQAGGVFIETDGKKLNISNERTYFVLKGGLKDSWLGVAIVLCGKDWHREIPKHLWYS